MINITYITVKFADRSNPWDIIAIITEMNEEPTLVILNLLH